mmetsp:Transcript_15819/g.40220  ORF Transcript_15819/g.40220 Transcript_15819/m.40220 type:complete len:138 (-) Transcript_15819:67-480(-)
MVYFDIARGLVGALIGFTIIMLLASAWVSQRRMRLQLSQPPQLAIAPLAFLSAATFAQIDQAKIDELCPEERMQGEADCAICLEKVKDGDSCRRLHCEHTFHSSCIDEWWINGRGGEMKCPLCRRGHQQPGDSVIRV